MEVKKFIEFINENKSVTESDIREYIKEEWNIATNNLFVKIGSKFPLDNNNLSEEDQNKLNSLVSQLIDLYTSMTIENISTFNKTWENEDEKIIEGDTVVAKDGGEEFYVTRFGANNNFYDGNKHRFISLDTVIKKKK